MHKLQKSKIFAFPTERKSAFAIADAYGIQKFVGFNMDNLQMKKKPIKRFPLNLIKYAQ